MTHEKILIVDDNDVNRQVLVGMLGKEGYTLLEAANGLHAVEVAHRECPDLVLLDIMMPIMDGYEVCQRLKDDPMTADLPVVFLSALTDAHNKVKGLDLGAVDYITKPFEHVEVLARVRTHLKIRRLTQDLLAANSDLLEKQRTLDADLRAAGDIQQSLIPKTVPLIDGVQVAWRFAPSDRIGGDLFNLHYLNNTHVVAYVVDISGHGVPAAMVTVSVSQSLSPHTGYVLTDDVALQGRFRIASPQHVLNELDHEYPIERFEKYFTICYVVLSLADGRVRYSRAGHPIPVLLRADGSLERLEAGGTIIGLGGVVPFEEAEVQLRQGDRIFLFTDGIVEFENADGESYGEDRLLLELQQTQSQSVDDACGRVLESMAEFGNGVSPQDDVTLLAIQYLGA